MTEEIKESIKELEILITALDGTERGEEHNAYTVKCIKNVIDCITNLQQDLDKANDIIVKDRQFYKCRMDEYVDLKKENERLKEENKHIFSKVNDDELLISNAMNYAEAQDYKSRCEKAMELLKLPIVYETHQENGERDELLKKIRQVKDILNGSDENETKKS